MGLLSDMVKVRILSIRILQENTIFVENPTSSITGTHYR